MIRSVEKKEGGNSFKKNRTSQEIQTAMNDIKKLQDELLEFLSTSSNNSIPFLTLGNQYLDKVLEILSMSSKLIPAPEGKNSEYGLQVLRRHTSKQQEQNNDDRILSVDEFLDVFINTIEAKLRIESIKLPFTIYPPKHITIIEDGNDESEVFDEKEIQEVPKLKIFLQILNEKEIPFEHITVFEEDENSLDREKRMRKFPYRIIYLKDDDIEKTILISDELGQATYVYDGIIKEYYFYEFSKGDIIQDVVPERIIFGKNYSKRLEKAVFTKREKAEIGPGIYLDIEGNDLDIVREQIVYRNTLLNCEEDLNQAGILNIDGVWYFSDSIPARAWPKINGRALKSFPNLTYNKSNGLGNNQGQIQSGGELSRLFDHLGLRVATEEEEQNRLINRWKNILIQNKNELEDAGIYEEENIWYFYYAKAMKFWPKIGEKKLRHFPNSNFIRQKLGEEIDSCLNTEPLKKIFTALGLQVATIDQEIHRIKRDSVNSLHETEGMLKLYGIVYGNGKWNLDSLSGDFLSIDIKGVKLRNFPNIVFNRDFNIGGKDGRLTSSKKSIQEMLEVLGEKVSP